MDVERLFAWSYLWAWGFCSAQEYSARLDRLFSETPDNSLLLELEGCSGSYKETFAELKRYFEYTAASFDADLFGKTLFHGLEIAYRSEVYPMAEFGKRCFQLWKLLPGFLAQEQPFWTLAYGDDPLSWGDEAQSRMLYEEAFRFYKDPG